jgi:copper chaperone NosL
MNTLSRILVGTAALLLVGMFVFPIWQIHLTAPQYPEGLGMQIRIDAIEGNTEFDLESINNLNHYIGMKRIESDAIPELDIMLWLVGALVVTGFAVAALGRRRALYAWVAAFGALALAGLADFWRWEYDYGHNLDLENAIITIPGMSFQPPLIGTKQLANFTATSLPGIGGCLAFLAFALAAATLVITLRSRAARQSPSRDRAVALHTIAA